MKTGIVLASEERGDEWNTKGEDEYSVGCWAVGIPPVDTVMGVSGYGRENVWEHFSLDRCLRNTLLWIGAALRIHVLFIKHGLERDPILWRREKCIGIFVFGDRLLGFIIGTRSCFYGSMASRIIHHPSYHRFRTAV